MPRKILVSDTSGTFHITVPDNAKLTFGPTIPYTPSTRPGYAQPERAYSLRVYLGSKENLYAVFPDVKGFRDLSIEVEPVVPPDADDLEMSETDEQAVPVRRSRPDRNRSAREIVDQGMRETENLLVERPAPAVAAGGPAWERDLRSSLRSYAVAAPITPTPMPHGGLFQELYESATTTTSTADTTPQSVVRGPDGNPF
jgi:hypothetical protein